MNKIDLHLHSTASDGLLSPEALVSKAAELGLTVIALADHDTVAGIAPALAAARTFPQLEVIPGIEISTETTTGEVHILGYFLDYTSLELTSLLQSFRNSREIRAQRMVTRLKNLGINIEWKRVREIAGGGTVGRPHVAQAMLEKGYISSLAEAFAKYIGHGGPAYVERDKMTPAEAVKLIIRANGLPVLAHPSTVNNPQALVIELKAAGLVGIEAYYKDYTAEETEGWVSLARRHNLIATGGSDYHGLDDSTEVMIGGTVVPPECVERLMALAAERKVKSISQT